MTTLQVVGVVFGGLFVMILAYLVAVIFTAFQLSGQYFAVQIGFGMSEERVLDPQTGKMANANFHAAAQQGLSAQFTWLEGETMPAQDLLRRLVPMAHTTTASGSNGRTSRARKPNRLNSRPPSRTGSILHFANVRPNAGTK